VGRMFIKAYGRRAFVIAVAVAAALLAAWGHYGFIGHFGYTGHGVHSDGFFDGGG